MSQNESAHEPKGAEKHGGEQSPAASHSASTEEITYHAVEKEGQVTAIWEMQGRKHLRTIDPRSRQGQEILRLYSTDHHADAAGGQASPGGTDASS